METGHAVELPNGQWLHSHCDGRLSEAQARDWAKRCGGVYRGTYSWGSERDSAPYTAAWCEAYGDNH